MSLFRASHYNITAAYNVFSAQNLICRTLCIVKTSCEEFPSGWKPPSDSPKSVPFNVRRSRSNNLPVYLDYKNGRARIITIIRNVEGNLETMESMLRDHLNISQVLTRVDNVTGQIIVKGNYRNETKLFLRDLGF